MRWLHAALILGLLLSGWLPGAAATVWAGDDSVAASATRDGQPRRNEMDGRLTSPSSDIALSDVGLALTTAKGTWAPGASGTVTLTLTHRRGPEAHDLTLSLFFDPALVTIEDAAGGEVMEGEVRWREASLASGSAWTRDVRVRVKKQFALETEVRARVEGEDLYATRHATLLLHTSPPPEVAVRLLPGQGGELVGLDGRLTLVAPGEAITEPVTIHLQWLRPEEDDPWYVFERFRLWGENDRGEEVAQFPAPLQLRLARRVRPAHVAVPLRATSEPIAGEPTFFWLNEQGQWTKMGGEYDSKTGTLTLAISHFSTWAAGEDASFGELGLPQLKVDAASLFSGGFHYAYPLAQTPGPGGFGPGLSLTYSDEVANTAWDGDRMANVVYRTQASVVGYGWQIGGLGKISIDWHASPVKAYLSFAGGSYELKYINQTWRTEPESFLKIWRDGQAQSDVVDELLRVANWRVQGQDGTIYTFGNGDGAGTAYFRRDKAACGRAPYAYYLTRVQDVHNNDWRVTYKRDTSDFGQNDCFNHSPREWVRATYPSQISVYRNGSEIGRYEFIYESRLDTGIKAHGDAYKQGLWSDSRVDKILVKSADAGQLRLLFEYDLDYGAYSHGTSNNCDNNTRTCTHSLLRGVVLRPRYNPGGGLGPDRTTTFSYWTHSGAGFSWVDINFSAIYLQRIQNGHGGELFLYREAHDYLQSGLQYETPINGHYRQRLLAARVADGMGNYVWTTFSYSGGAYDTQGTTTKDDDEFAGYATVDARLHEKTTSNSETPPGHGSSLRSKTLYSFKQGLGNWPDDVLRGKLWRTDSYVTLSGDVYHRLVHRFSAVTRVADEVAWPRLDKTLWHVDKGGNGWDKRCTTYSYDTALQGGDQYGLVTHAEDRPDWCDSAPYRTTITQYAVKDDGVNHVYMVRPAQKKVKDGGGVCRSLTQYFYYAGNAVDGSAEAGFGDPGNKGLLRRERTATDKDGDCGTVSSWAETQYTYHADGNPRRVTAPPNHAGVRSWTETTWDSVHGAYPVQVTNNLNQTTSAQYDLALGVAISRTDANGVTHEFQYDGYGRLRKRWAEPQDKTSGDTRPTEEILYYEGTTGTNVACSGSWCVHRKQLDEAGNDNYLHSYTFLDGLGRVIQTQAEGESQHIVKDAWYDANGQKAKESVPYFSSAAFGTYHAPQSQPFTQYDYDALGRVSVVTAPDGTETRTYYRGYKTAVIDANDHMTMQERDDWGRLVYARQYTGTYSTVNWSASPYATASYSYDVLDRLTGVTDPGGAQTSISYDLAGRKTSMTDPDMGAWAYRYDAAGNLRKQQDARNQAICFYYDALNRLVGKTYHANISNLDALTCSGSYAVSYSYDSTASGNKGVGRRTGMSGGSGSTSWVYDARGRVTRETKTITGAGTFVTQWTYDAMDRVQTMTYPDGETVTTTYNAQGLARALSSTVFGDIVIDSAYNAANQPTERRLGTGGGIWYKQLFAYDPNTFRLTSLKAGNNWDAFDNLINMSYEYDAVGNVVSIADAAATGGAQTQAFKMGNGAPGYDELNRLKRAQATGGSYGVYGPYTYDYAPNGNVTQFQGKGFAYNDPAHKHALTHVDGVQKYWYDENGNMTRRISSAGDHTLAYDAENRLTSITHTSGGGFVAAYVYDGDGVRVKEQKSNYTRYFVGDYYEIEGSIVRKYYSLGGARVAESYNGVLYFLLTDHLGSTALTTARTGGRVGELRYYPFGVWRYKWGSPKTSYRYTGQRWDSGTGLYWYRSRWYDPEIGRFIQPDTIVPNPGDPQSLNRYVYVRNNPLRYTDPSGHARYSGDDYDPADEPIPISSRQNDGDPFYGESVVCLGSISCTEESNPYDLSGEIVKLAQLAALEYEIPYPLLAVVLQMENDPHARWGIFRRRLKQYFTPLLQQINPGHDGGWGYSLGIANVKVLTAQMTLRYVRGSYSSSELAKYGIESEKIIDTLSTPEKNLLFAAAILRQGIDRVYYKGYDGPMSQKGLALVINFYNIGEENPAYLNAGYGPTASEILSQSVRGGSTLIFYPCRAR